jgi:hypothetical protein
MIFTAFLTREGGLIRFYTWRRNMVDSHPQQLTSAQIFQALTVPESGVFKFLNATRGNEAPDFDAENILLNFNENLQDSVAQAKASQARYISQS